MRSTWNGSGGDQREIAGSLGQCTGGLRGDPGDIGPCGQERYLECVDVIRQGSKLGLHAAD